MISEKIIGGVLVREIRVSSALSRSGLPEYDYSLNPYIGCQHACVYCYAIDFTRGEPGEKWGEVVYVKINLVNILSREIRRKRPGVVGVSTITDPYIPLEAVYSLTRRSLEILFKNRFRVSIQTKSALVIRDLDLFERYRDLVDIGFTITTLDPGVKKIIEPRSSHPLAVERALRKISSRGIRTWIFIGPLIPGVNDDLENIKSIVSLAKETNSEVIIDRFREHPGAVNNMRIRLGEDFVDKILLRNNISWWRNLSENITRICREENVSCSTADDYWRRLREESITTRGPGHSR